MSKKAKLGSGLFWRGDTIWGRVQVKGRDHKRSLHTSSPATAARELDRWREELRSQVHGTDRRHTWQEAVVRWSAETLPGLKPATAERYLCSVRMVHGILGDLYLDQVDRRVLADVAARAGPSIATRRRDLDAVASVLHAAEGWEWIDAAPDFQRARRGLRERREPIRPPSAAEVAAVLAVMPPDFRRLIQFLSLTGMRMEEAAGLERRSVDWRKGEATLWATKTSRPRTIALRTIVGDAMAVLEEIPPRIGCPWLFYHAGGERFRNVSSRFALYAKRAGCRFRLHDLRHRFAHEWLRAGGDIYRLSLHLGHSSVKVTDQIYGGWVRRGPEQKPEQSEVG